MLSRSWFCLLFVCGKACVADALVVVMPYTPVQCETILLAFFAPRTFHPAGASWMAPFAIIGAAQTRSVTHTRSPFNSACSACMLRSPAQGLPRCRRETLAASSRRTLPSMEPAPCILPSAGIQYLENACTSRMMAYPLSCPPFRRRVRQPLTAASCRARRSASVIRQAGISRLAASERSARSRR